MSGLTHQFSLVSVSVLHILENVFKESALLSFILDCIGNPALLSLLGARLLFNMKEAGAKGLNQGTSCGSKSTVSEIDFMEPQAGTGHSLEDAEAAEAIEMEEIC